MKERILSLFVVLSLLMTMLPTTFLATETTTNEAYLELVDQMTGELFEGAVLEKAYYAESKEEVAFEKVNEGKYKLILDKENHGQEFVICEIDFPEGYRQVGYDIEPIGDWVFRWTDSLVVEVINLENGSGEFSFGVWDETNEMYLEGSEISVYLYKDATDFMSERVTLVNKAVTDVTFEYDYKDGMFVYNGKSYKDLLIHVDFPFGYTYRENTLSNYANQNIWYSVSTLAGQTWNETYAKKYLEDSSITEKEVYIQFLDGNTGMPFSDISLVEAFYDLDTEVQYNTLMKNVGEGKFKFVLEGKEHKNQTIWAFFNCPEGFVFEGTEETTFSDYVDRWFVEGETINIKVVSDEEGIYEKELTEDTISYEFITADGTVVDGTKVTVSLCNQMESADKVVIGESVSGKGEFTVAHMGGFYYKDDLPYEYVEISYSFPNGYVLSDSEGLTGATVYYTVVDLCSGSKDITWLLEKAEEIIVQVPEDDSEDNKAMIILPEEKDEISNDMMDTVLEANKKYDVEIKSNNDVIFMFKAGEMKSIEGKTTYDFGVEIKTDYTSLKDATFEEKDFVLRINYDYSGELPGNAEISIPVGDKWIGKMLYYYQILENGTYKYTGQKAIVDENGVYKIHQNHCSDYIITAEKLETDVDETNSNTNENTDSTPALDKTAPDTGDNTFVCGYIMMLFAGLVMVAVRFSDKRRVH